MDAALSAGVSGGEVGVSFVRFGLSQYGYDDIPIFSYILYNI